MTEESAEIDRSASEVAAVPAGPVPPADAAVVLPLLRIEGVG